MSDINNLCDEFKQYFTQQDKLSNDFLLILQGIADTDWKCDQKLYNMDFNKKVVNKLIYDKILIIVITDNYKDAFSNNPVVNYTIQVSIDLDVIYSKEYSNTLNSLDKTLIAFVERLCPDTSDNQENN